MLYILYRRQLLFARMHEATLDSSSAFLSASILFLDFCSAMRLAAAADSNAAMCFACSLCAWITEPSSALCFASNVHWRSCAACKKRREQIARFWRWSSFKDSQLPPPSRRVFCWLSRISALSSASAVIWASASLLSFLPEKFQNTWMDFTILWRREGYSMHAMTHRYIRLDFFAI